MIDWVELTDSHGGVNTQWNIHTVKVGIPNSVFHTETDFSVDWALNSNNQSVKPEAKTHNNQLAKEPHVKHTHSPNTDRATARR